MKEILFKAKRTDNGKWVQGNLLTYGNKAYIVADEDVTGFEDEILSRIYWKVIENRFEVDPATVGQYTGLTDKNGTKIFEGDILKYPDYSGGTRFFAEQPKTVDVVKWNEKTASFTVGGNRLFYLVDTQKCEVIGNIRDNPELLKGGVINE